MAYVDLQSNLNTQGIRNNSELVYITGNDNLEKIIKKISPE
jgi:hypothetical protein